MDVDAGVSGVGEIIDHALDDQVQVTGDQVVDEETEVGQVFAGGVSENPIVDEGVEVGQDLDEVVFDDDQVLVVVLMDVLVKMVIEVVQLVVISGTDGVSVYPQFLEIEVLEVELVLFGHECIGHEMGFHDRGCKAASVATAAASMRTKDSIWERFARLELGFEYESRE